MLAQISIRNLAVIEQLHVEFVRGFQALTGETGAGKSIVIDALGLIAGARGSSELIRHGHDKAEIEAMFDLPVDHEVWEALGNLGIEADKSEPLIIRRELGNNKSTARINGQLVNLTMLREVGDYVVNLHGQHEHQSLLRTDKHLYWLDQYGADAIEPLKLQYGKTYQAYTQSLRELEELRSSIQYALQMGDLYRFQAEEIASASLHPGEDDQLEKERLLLSGGEKLLEAISGAYDGIFEGGKALESLATSIDRLQTAVSFDEARLLPLLEQIQSAYYQLEDAAFQLRDYRDRLEFEPARLNEVEQRLNQLAGLKRKYGSTLELILSHFHKISADLENLSNQDERIQQLETLIEQYTVKLGEQAAKLSSARRKAADTLAAEIERHLSDLNMERTRFVVHFETAGELIFTKDGTDKIEFLISANPGEPPRPLAKIASGGELSRIMLALKTIFASIDRIPVLVFDEVDTGVSGKAAQAIARKLSVLSNDCQVFSVTHLPQVASMADAHYLIYKEINADRTFTKVEPLMGERRVEELARMLGGAQITETTLNHAREMIELSKA